jgi:hypothetical protein
MCDYPKDLTLCIRLISNVPLAQTNNNTNLGHYLKIAIKKADD